MPKSLLDQLSKIVAAGRQQAELGPESLEGLNDVRVQTQERTGIR